jgi:hypothetical protein
MAHTVASQPVALQEALPLDVSVARAVFDKIKFPKETNVRYSRLKQKFDIVAHLAMEHKGKYKHLFALLTKEENFLRNFAAAHVDPPEDKSGDETELGHAGATVLLPQTKSERKRGRISDGDVANHAKKKEKTKK